MLSMIVPSSALRDLLRGSTASIGRTVLAVSSMRVPVGRPHMQLELAAIDEGKKSWPSHG